jgi:hypothetical protein
MRQYAAAIIRGDGLVARFGDTLTYIRNLSPSAASLISAVESVANVENPGAAIAEDLATVIFRMEPEQAFAVVTPTTNGLLVLLRGNVTAEINSAEGSQVLSGAHAVSWHDQIIPTVCNISTLTVGTKTGLTVVPYTDLRAGIVLGGGFTISAIAATVPPVDTVASQAVQSPAETAASQAVRARSTSSHTLANAGRTPALVVTEDDIYPLDRCYVLGRNPRVAEEVRNAMASPITLDEDQHISRVHAFISVDRGVVFVRDNSTPGGTFIASPGSDEWIKIGSTPRQLEPEWRIMIGERILTYRMEP